MMALYIFIYGALLCFLRFSGVSGSYIPLFALFGDKSFFPGDIYVHKSFILTSGYFFPLMKAFGKLPANTYFIFFLYVLVSFVHIYFIYKIAETLFPQFKKENIGLIAILLFLYDYPIFRSISQLVCQHTFSQTVVVMPVLAAGIYYFLKDKISLAVFLLAVIAAPLHLKSAWFILFIILVYGLIYFKSLSFRTIIACGAFLLAGFLILKFFEQRTLTGNYSFGERLELCNLAIKRAPEDVSIFLNPKIYFFNLVLVFGLGTLAVRSVIDLVNRRKLYLMYLITVLVLILGAIYAQFMYKFFPCPQIILFAFPRVTAYPIIISLVLIAGLLMQGIIHPANTLIKRLCIFGLFFFAFFPNFKLSVFIYIACAGISYFSFYLWKKLSLKMVLTPLAAWLYMSCILFLFIRAGINTYKSYQEGSPVFPLRIFELEKYNYDCQLWAKKNTLQDSVFLFYVRSGSGLSEESTFRMFSGRSMLTGDYANFALDYDLNKEHQRRADFTGSIANLIFENKQDKIKILIANSPWRIDYLILPKEFSLDYPRVYSNDKYSCYFIRQKKKR